MIVYVLNDLLRIKVSYRILTPLYSHILTACPYTFVRFLGGVSFKMKTT